MRFLADESCDFAIVRALRAAGHDVAAVAENAPSLSDDAVAAVAHRENRILLTEDKDFGQLVFAGGSATCGVVLVRFPASVRRDAPRAVTELAAREGDKLLHAFAVATPGRLRILRR